MLRFSWMAVLAASVLTPADHLAPACPRRALPAGPAPAGRHSAGALHDPAPIVVVPRLPFSDSTTTCGRPNALQPPCAVLSSAPEVVYAYTPSSDLWVDLEVCGAGFDPVVFVMRPDSVVRCDDDGCGPSSQLVRIPLRGGTTYYVVVDGWDTFCGSFALRLEESAAPCPVPCPAASFSEGEVVCHPTYVDTYDCGCNQFPAAFRDLPCGDGKLTVCGNYGTYAYYSEEWRDTDWYRFTLPEAGPVACRVTGQAETQLAVMHAVDGCDDRPLVCASMFGSPCSSVGCEPFLAAGTYYVFVATRAFLGVPCGAEYVLELEGLRCSTVGVRAASWSRVRALYR